MAIEEKTDTVKALQDELESLASGDESTCTKPTKNTGTTADLFFCQYR